MGFFAQLFASTIGGFVSGFVAGYFVVIGVNLQSAARARLLFAS
jgi:hypothetical protein